MPIVLMVFIEFKVLVFKILFIEAHFIFEVITIQILVFIETVKLLVLVSDFVFVESISNLVVNRFVCIELSFVQVVSNTSVVLFEV